MTDEAVDGTAPAISARGVTRRYGDRRALDGVDLEVAHGEIVAILGPNGAGKTTLVEILEGYRARDAGDVRVLGQDPAEPTRAWRGRIGIVLQSFRVQPRLTAHEAVELFAGYYPAPRDPASTLAQVGLSDSADVRVGRMSGGQQRRLDLALALIGDPELVFLDEPTTGFDPSARRGSWELVEGLRETGTTVVLTTHYMDEAQALADRVVVLARGRVVAEGPPDELGGRRGAESVVTFHMPDCDGAPLPPGARRRGGAVEFRTARPTADLHELSGWALRHGVELAGLEVRRPSLEDVYLELTGEEPPT